MVSYRALLQTLEAVLLHGPDALPGSQRGDFSHALQVFEDDFRNLLARPPPRPEDRAQVLSREVRLPDSPPTVLDDQDAEIVLKLSHDFHLNEIDCVSLLVATHQEWSIVGRAPLEIVRLASGLYLTERRSLLTALHLLLRLVVLEEELVDPGVAAEVREYVQRLLQQGGLRARILALIKELPREEPAGAGGPGTEPYVMDTREALVQRRNVAQRERLLLAQCLVYTCLIRRIGPAEAKEMYALLADTVADCARSPDPILFRIAYTMMFALMSALVSDSLSSSASSASSADDDLPPQLAPDATFCREFQDLVTARPAAAGSSSSGGRGASADGVLAVVRLTWATCLSSSPAAARACLDTPTLLAALRFLSHDVLPAAVFQNDDADLTYVYTTYIHKLLCSFLTQPLGRQIIKALKDAAINAADSSSSNPDEEDEDEDGGNGVGPGMAGSSGAGGAAGAGAGASEEAQGERAYLALLQLVAQVYQREPELMVDNAALWTFVLFAGDDHRGYKTMTAFLDLLTALSSGEEGARQVYQLLQEGAFRVVSWSTLWRTVSVYDQRFRDSLAATGAVLTPFPAADARALEAYLRCLKKVMQEGAEAERGGWFADVEPLFKLLQYEVVPPRLKGALRGAIAAFVPVGAASRDAIWRMLEHYDLPVAAPPQTAPDGTPQQVYDMAYELNEVEARQEEYPSTLSYLELVNLLLAADADASADPQQGRKYSAYFRFVRDQVFLPYAQRAYADAAQKWRLLVAALSHFHAMLALFQPTRESLQQGPPLEGQMIADTGALALEPPGQELMKDLMAGRGVFRNVMGIVMLGADAVLEDRAAAPHGPALEEALRLCLRLLELALSKDALLADAWRPASQPLHVVLGYDTRQMARLVEYVRYDADPEIQQSSIRIMAVLSARVPQLVPIIAEEEGGAARLIDDYAACLEARLHDPHAPAELEHDSGYLILQMLLANLERPAPNVTHMLLRFDLEQPVEHSALQPKRDFSCLRVILEFLEAGGDAESNARLHEMAYELLHALCVDPLTGVPTLELLRSPRYDLFVGHVERLASEDLPKRTTSQPHRISSLQQRAWLLKLLAFALHVADIDVVQQRDSCRHILARLFGGGSSADEEEQLAGGRSSGSLALALLPSEAGKDGLQHNSKMLELLEGLQFQLPDARPNFSPQTEALHQELQLSEILGNTAVVEEGGVYQLSHRGDRLVDLGALKDTLWQEYKRAEVKLAGGGQAGGGSQAAAALREAVQSALQWAWRSNRHTQEAAAQLHLALAWSQLVEVAVSRRSHLLPQGGHAQLLYELLNATLTALISPDCSLHLALPLSQVAMTIMAKLQQQSLAPAPAAADDEAAGDVTYLDLLASARLPNGTCHAVLAKLVGAIVRPDSSGMLRRRLYTALLCYLEYCQGADKRHVSPSVMHALHLDGVAGEDDAEIELMEKQRAELEGGNLAILKQEATALVDIVTRDAVHGSEVGRALAFCVLGALLAEDRQLAVFLSQLQSRGLLQLCLSDIASNTYQAVLHASADAVRRLYTLEAQLGLLLRVAFQTKTRGAHALLSMGALSALSSCPALDTPLLSGVGDDDEEMGGVAAQAGGGRLLGVALAPQRERRHQIVGPLLRLVHCFCALLPPSSSSSSSSSGPSHAVKSRDEVASQLADFVRSHESLMSHILSDASAAAHESDLEQLELATAILSRVWPGESSADHSGIQEMLLALTCTYLAAPAQSRVKYIQKARQVERNSDAAPDAQEAAHRMEEGVRRVRCHLLDYTRAMVAHHGLLLFSSASPSAPQPNGAGAMGGGGTGMSRAAGAGWRPTLQLLAAFLQHSTDELLAAVEDKAVVLAKVQDVNEMPRHELDELIKTYGHRAHTLLAFPDTIRRRRHLALTELARVAAAKERQLASLLYMIEHILDITYTHFQVLSSIPASSSSTPSEAAALSSMQVQTAQSAAKWQSSSASWQSSSELSTALGGGSSSKLRHELESMGARLLPALDKLELITEERVGQSVEHLKRQLQWLRAHLFLDSSSALL